MASEPSGPTSATPVQVDVVADWNDVVPAVLVAVARAEMAVVSTSPEACVIRFELVAATDEQGTLVATRQEPTTDNPGGEGVSITLSAHVGHFGDARRERRLLQAVQRRLGQLRGVATAPVRW